MFELVALQTPLRPVVVRTAQVTGGVNGYWKADEWVPSIVESAMVVNCLPAMEPVSLQELRFVGSQINS
jgi:hypothetical protein